MQPLIKTNEPHQKREQSENIENAHLLCDWRKEVITTPALLDVWGESC